MRVYLLEVKLMFKGLLELQKLIKLELQNFEKNLLKFWFSVFGEGPSYIFSLLFAAQIIISAMKFIEANGGKC